MRHGEVEDVIMVPVLVLSFNFSLKYITKVQTLRDLSLSIHGKIEIRDKKRDSSSLCIYVTHIF